ncbi:RNA-directed DNA polymerase, eukaryota [Tanacetum coccineum]|uniref:RNA-directed DNA polymerase, eukaryota n=1 Tax=Tanacetum coccineum TaxID=301880 RepID=A0ABQ4YHT8_9ASTR
MLFGLKLLRCFTGKREVLIFMAASLMALGLELLARQTIYTRKISSHQILFVFKQGVALKFGFERTFGLEMLRLISGPILDSVGTSRRIIDAKLLPSLEISTSWDKILPLKVNIFIWRLSLDRLPYRLNLLSRGIDIPKISCSSCNGNVESSNHIFFACDIAMEVWRLVRNWCDITFPLFTSFEHWKNWFVLWHCSKEKKIRLYVIVASSLWWLWRGHMACNWVDWLKSPLLIARGGFG